MMDPIDQQLLSTLKESLKNSRAECRARAIEVCQACLLQEQPLRCLVLSQYIEPVLTKAFQSESPDNETLAQLAFNLAFEGFKKAELAGSSLLAALFQVRRKSGTANYGSNSGKGMEVELNVMKDSVKKQQGSVISLPQPDYNCQHSKHNKNDALDVIPEVQDELRERVQSLQPQFISAQMRKFIAMEGIQFCLHRLGLGFTQVYFILQILREVKRLLQPAHVQRAARTIFQNLNRFQAISQEDVKAIKQQDPECILDCIATYDSKSEEWFVQFYFEVYCRLVRQLLANPSLQRKIVGVKSLNDMVQHTRAKRASFFSKLKQQGLFELIYNPSCHIGMIELAEPFFQLLAKEWKLGESEIDTLFRLAEKDELYENVVYATLDKSIVYLRMYCCDPLVSRFKAMAEANHVFNKQQLDLVSVLVNGMLSSTGQSEKKFVAQLLFKQFLLIKKSTCPELIREKLVFILYQQYKGGEYELHRQFQDELLDRCRLDALLILYRGVKKFCDSTYETEVYWQSRNTTSLFVPDFGPRLIALLDRVTEFEQEDVLQRLGQLFSLFHKHQKEFRLQPFRLQSVLCREQIVELGQRVSLNVYFPFLLDEKGSDQKLVESVLKGVKPGQLAGLKQKGFNALVKLFLSANGVKTTSSAKFINLNDRFYLREPFILPTLFHGIDTSLFKMILDQSCDREIKKLSARFLVNLLDANPTEEWEEGFSLFCLEFIARFRQQFEKGGDRQQLVGLLIMLVTLASYSLKQKGVAQCHGYRQTSQILSINVVSVEQRKQANLQLTVPDSSTLFQLKKMVAERLQTDFNSFVFQDVMKEQLSDFDHAESLRELGFKNSSFFSVEFRACSGCVGKELPLTVDGDLSQPAKAAFRQIVSRYTTTGRLSSDDVKKLIKDCVMSNQTSFIETMLRELYNYDDDKDGYLTADNIIAFYKNAAVYREYAVRKNLTAFGYKQDFRLQSAHVEVRQNFNTLGLLAEPTLYAALEVLEQQDFDPVVSSLLAKLPSDKHLMSRLRAEEVSPTIVRSKYALELMEELAVKLSVEQKQQFARTEIIRQVKTMTQSLVSAIKVISPREEQLLLICISILKALSPETELTFELKEQDVQLVLEKGKIGLLQSLMDLLFPRPLSPSLRALLLFHEKNDFQKIGSNYLKKQGGDRAQLVKELLNDPLLVHRQHRDQLFSLCNSQLRWIQDAALKEELGRLLISLLIRSPAGEPILIELIKETLSHSAVLQNWAQLIEFVFPLRLCGVDTAPMVGSPIADAGARLQLFFVLAKTAVGNQPLAQELSNRFSDFLCRLPIRRPEGEQQNGFVGLQNQGATCYMNAMIQQFFAVSAFREGILSVKSSEEPKLVEMGDYKMDDNLLVQLQRLFAALSKSKARSFNTKDFCYSFKEADGTPVKTSIQQDTQEFLNKFIDRLETLLKGTARPALISENFEGKCAIIITCKECKHQRVKDETFFNLSVLVNGCTTLYQSLDKLTQEELIDDFFCEHCARKQQIGKRLSLKELPPVLIVQLQRMVFNMEVLMNVKIHSRLEFPNTLSLDRYLLSPLPRSEYRLRGIVIHSGTAQSGHYYSFIRSRTGAWHKYDDSSVSAYDPNDIPADCFGGGALNSYSWDSEMSSNAYILLYELDQPNEVPASPNPFSQAVALENYYLERENLIFSPSFAPACGKYITSLLDVGQFQTALSCQLRLILKVYPELATADLSEAIRTAQSIFQDKTMLSPDYVRSMYRWTVENEQGWYEALTKPNREVRGVAKEALLYIVGQADSKGIFADQLVGLLMDKMKVIHKCWTKFSEYFEFWRDFICKTQNGLRFGLDREVIALFCDFMLQKQSPINMGLERVDFRHTFEKPDFTPALATVVHLVRQILHPTSAITRQFSEKQRKIVFSQKTIEFFSKDSKLVVEVLGLIQLVCKNNKQLSLKLATLSLQELNKGPLFQDFQVILRGITNQLEIEDELSELRIGWLLGYPQLKLWQGDSPGLGEKLSFGVWNYPSSCSRKLDSLLTYMEKDRDYITKKTVLSIKELLRLMQSNGRIFKYLALLPPANYLDMCYFDWYFSEIINYSNRTYCSEYEERISFGATITEIKSQCIMVKEMINSLEERCPYPRWIYGRVSLVDQVANEVTYVMDREIRSSFLSYKGFFLPSLPAVTTNKALPEEFVHFDRVLLSRVEESEYRMLLHSDQSGRVDGVSPGLLGEGEFFVMAKVKTQVKLRLRVRLPILEVQVQLEPNEQFEVQVSSPQCVQVETVGDPEPQEKADVNAQSNHASQGTQACQEMEVEGINCSYCNVLNDFTNQYCKECVKPLYM